MNKIEKIQPSHIFTNYIFKAIPLAFDESMSYYETLCGVLDLLHSHTEVINNNAEVVAELESYVEHYFDNLDIQEEVNNKLDAMVLDGTLGEIINQEIFGELNEQVGTNTNNIGDLQSLTSNLPTDETNIQNLQNFNEYTNQPLKYGKLNLPSEFNYYKFNLYRNNNGTIDDDLNLRFYDTNNIYYVDYDNGNDSNAGTEANPLKTIKQALTTINSQAGNNYKIICKSYRFSRDEFYSQAGNTYTLAKNVVIEPDDLTKQILVATDERGLSFTYENNMWHTTRSNVTNVYNMQIKTPLGEYQKLTKVNSTSECSSQVNSWCQSGNVIYIHTENNEEPTYDKYLITLNVGTGIFDLQNNRFLRLRNIDFYVAYYFDFINQSTTNYENTLIMENVKIFGNNNTNGFSINNIKTVYMLNCCTGDNLRDGFNYHYTTMPDNVIDSCTVYEKNCISFNNGLNDTNNTNNCSTIHEKGHIIRVNGLYQNSRGPAIADVDSSKTLMINCHVTQELSNNYFTSFMFQNAENENNGVAYIIDCSGIEKSNISFNGTTGFNIKLKNYHGNYINNDLNIMVYDE